jgi:protein O-GlcNAc transferase
MPTLTAAHNNLGALLKEQGKVDQAMAHFQEALRIDPRFADAFCNMGNGYREFGCHEDAIRCYEEAIRIDPCSGEALSNLGGVLREQGRLLEAVANYKRAVDAQPGFIDGFAGLVITNMMLCEWSTRKEDFAKLIDSVKSQVTIALRASRSSEAIKSGGSFEPSKSGTQLDSHSSSFSVHSGDEAFLSQNPETPSGDENLYKKDNLVVSRVGVDLMPSIEPFISLLLPFSLLELQQIAQRYAAKAEMRVCLVEARKTFKPRAKVDKIRIGYVSSDFGNHPVGQLMVPVFKMQNRKRFEVFCYATTRSDGSQWRSEIEQSCDRFKDISGLSAIEACRFIRNDFIHILIDLNGHTKNARTDVFALRPCSVQMQFMGFPGTMGASFIDYLVADPFVIPEQYREYYSEKLLYLPHTCFVNNHKHAYRDLADERMKTSRQRFGISEDKFVFCNFSQLHKLSPEIFDVWMRILKRVPNSILWLLRLPAAAEQNILEEALKRGIRADRFHFSEVVPKHEHLLRCFIADLALDTPMSGFHSAACDLLWAGTPFVSIPGERMTSRISSSILQASGLGDLICNSLVEYEELAVSLALDAEKLHLIRSRLEHAKDTCASFDTERMIRNLDIGLEKIWERVESGLPPDHTFVPDAGAVYKPLGNAIQFDAKREFLYNSTQGAVCEPASPDNRSYHSVDSYSTTTNNQTYSADSRANKSATGSASSASYKEDFDEGSLLSLDR